MRCSEPEAQAIFCRRRHQPRRPPLAKIRPGSPAPTMGAGHAHAVERKGRVKRWTRCRSGANDVGADPQPVRVQHLISCPALKIGEAAGERRSRWHNRPRCREPKKVSVGLGNFHLRDEEVVTRRQIERRGKVHREFVLPTRSQDRCRR